MQDYEGADNHVAYRGLLPFQGLLLLYTTTTSLIQASTPYMLIVAC